MGYRLYLRGVLDAQVYCTWEDAILAIIQLPGARYWWGKNRFPPDFQSRIEERLNHPESLPERFDEMFPWWGTQSQAIRRI